MSRQVKHQGTVTTADATVAATAHPQRSLLCAGLSNERRNLLLIARLGDRGRMGRSSITIEHCGQRGLIGRFALVKLHRALPSVPPTSR